MARGQEKVIVPKQDLPPISLLSDGSYGYIMRYRIVSEDQNRFSHWSPIREIPLPTVTPVDGAVSFSGNIASVTWGDDEGRPSYDVFVKFDSNDYFYHGTTSTHQYDFLIQEGATTLQVAVQLASTSNQRASVIQIFESETVNLLQLDGGFTLSPLF